MEAASLSKLLHKQAQKHKLNSQLGNNTCCPETMLSLPSLVPFPGALAPRNPKLSLTRTSGMQSQLLLPTSITEHDRFKAIKADIGFEKDDEKSNKGMIGMFGDLELPEGLKRDLMPRHVAILADGNRRWAKSRGLPAKAGQEYGRWRIAEIAALCSEWGIQVFTLFATSPSQWSRPEEEVNVSVSLLERSLDLGLPIFQSENIRVSVIGRATSNIPDALLKVAHKVEEATKDNSGLHFIVALDYSGRDDILQACKKIAGKVKDGVIQVEDVNESLMEQELGTSCTKFPHPDLFIRTSGEQRISNFLLWQMAYTELYFAQALWPDFGKNEFVEALTSYQNRQRRFGAQA